MPCLTLWDKISQNLTHLEANSHKIFQTSQNFQTILQHILWRNKHKSHFVLFITVFWHLNKGFWLFWGSSKSDFCKNLPEFYQISHKNLPDLTDFSPQLMACMQFDLFILDFEKAFDTPPHELLKSKLFGCGIGGKTLKWVDSFLSYRQ